MYIIENKNTHFLDTHYKQVNAPLLLEMQQGHGTGRGGGACFGDSPALTHESSQRWQTGRPTEVFAFDDLSMHWKQSTHGLVAMTSASHAEGRQFDPGWVYFI